MLSRLHNEAEHQHDIAVIDTEEWVDPLAIMDDDVADTLPLIHDGLNLTEIAQEQQIEFNNLWKLGEDDENDDYEIIRGVLYSTRPPRHTAPLYPRLVLPAKYLTAIITRSHADVGHMGMFKTLNRVAEAYVWPGMQSSIRRCLRMCPTCTIHSRRTERVAMGNMPLANYPMQIIGADLIGPLPESRNGSRYMLTIIDHNSGWGEAYPLKDKTNRSMLTAFANEFVPRHGVPEVLITDNGTEFTAHAFECYLAQLGVRHNVTTPVHPQSNGKTERFNRTIKDILHKLINNKPSDWEDRLGDALFAYRNSVSVTTGFTPHHLLYGRHARVPLSRMLKSSQHTAFGNRLDDLSLALRTTRTMTETNRRYNRERLAAKANAQHIVIGDSVTIKAQERTNLTSRWDPHWSVIRVKGPVLWLRHQQSAKEKVLHRDKIKLVDSTMVWDDCNPRPRRSQYRPRARLAKTVQLAQSPLGTPPTGTDPRTPTPLSSQGGDTPTDRRAAPPRKRRRTSRRDQGESPQVTAHLPRQIRTRQDSRRARDGDTHTGSEPQFNRRQYLKRNTTTTTTGTMGRCILLCTTQVFTAAALVMSMNATPVSNTSTPIALPDGLFITEQDDTRALIASWTVLVTINIPQTTELNLLKKLNRFQTSLLRHYVYQGISNVTKTIWDERINNIKATITNTHTTTRRRRRGLINIIGEISHTLFGTATEQEIIDTRYQLISCTNRIKKLCT